jgi:hypothetical protein
LREGDRVAYSTVRDRYRGDRESGWRLVAVLRVIHRFDPGSGSGMVSEEV